MEAIECIERVPATPEYVLNVLQDWYRTEYYCEYGRFPQTEFQFETTVDEWDCELGYEFYSWRDLSRYLNTMWRLELDQQMWKEVLYPEEDQTLRGVCELIARHVTVPVIREETFFGKPCRPASAFLAIRGLLEAKGVDVSDVGPATELGPYLKAHFRALVGSLLLLVPGRLPGVCVVRTTLHKVLNRIIFCLIGLGMAGLLLACVEPRGLYLFLILVPLYLVVHFIAYRLRPARIELGELQTFRDLAELVAETDLTGA